MKSSKYRQTDIEFLRLYYEIHSDYRKKYIKHKLEIDDNIISDLISQGYRKTDINRKLLCNNVKSDFDNALKNLKIRPPRDLSKIKNHSEYMDVSRLGKNELIKGEDSFRNKIDNIQMKDPLIESKACLKLCFDEELINYATKYLGTFPVLSYVKVVKNYANKLPLFDTQYFHIDTTAIKLFKVIFYLNDVDLDSGPFCYVDGSHKKLEEHWNSNKRLTNQDIVDKFGKNSIIPVISESGMAIFADTTGFHKGIKPKNNDRYIIIITYCAHQDFIYNNKLDEVPKIKLNDYSEIDDYFRPVGDVLDIIN